MLILCDFDGTVTTTDVTDLIWNEKISPVERQRMVDLVSGGHWTMLRYIAHGYSCVTEPPDTLLAKVNSKIEIRHGWEVFLEAVTRAGADLHMVSNGLDLYIRQYIPDNIPVWCFTARYTGHYHVELPSKCCLAPGEEFKVSRAKHLIAGSSPERAIYIGDGRADFAPSLLCDTVFAVRESRLAQLRRSHSLDVIEFDSFDEIAAFVATRHSKQLLNVVPSRATH